MFTFSKSSFAVSLWGICRLGFALWYLCSNCV